MTTFARQILANYQAKTADKRLPSQPGPLKTQQTQAIPIPAWNTLTTAAALPTDATVVNQRKGHKRALVSNSDLPSSSSDSDPDPIVLRQPKRTKPNPLPPSSSISQSTHKPRHTHHTSQGTPQRLALNAVKPKRRSFTPHFPRGIPWEEFKSAFNKTRLARRIFERDFPRYNQALNETSAHTRSESQGRDYVPAYLSDSSVTPGNSTRESSLQPIGDEDLFGYTTQPVEFDPLTSIQTLRVPKNTPEPEPGP